MKISILSNPERKITQDILYFQFRFMDWNADELEYQNDRFGTLPFGYVVAHVDSQLVGVLNLLRRKITHKKQSITLGGFGGVCTHKKYRRQGIATKLLTIGMNALKEKHCDIAFLNTDLKKLKDLYSQVGFVPLPSEYKATGESGKIYRGSNGMIAPVNSKKIYQQIMKHTGTFDLQGQDW